ncbi:MAG TPA: pyridoxal-phosphate dependent enzyme [Planktothrix sp.]
MTEEILLSDILSARKRVKEHVNNTPLRKSIWLSDATGAEVLLKLENLQETGSFKLRGALNAMKWARENHQTKIFTASAGNHGLGIAEASRITEQEVTVCIPKTASPLKKQRLKSYNIALIEHGEEFEVTEAYARRLANEKKGLYISPYNNKEVIAGQGTVALEMFSAVPQLDTIVVAVGGGGLIGGIGVVAKAINPKVRVIGAVAANSPAMSQSISSGRIIKSYVEKTLADGIAGNIEQDSITFPLVQEVVDDWVVIEEPEIQGCIFEFLDNEGMLIEGAAAVAVAAVSRKHFEIKPKERVGIVVCGGNIARQDWREILVQHLVGAKRAV